MRRSDKMRSGLRRDSEGIVGINEAVGHAGGVEGGGWIAVAVEEDEATGSVGAMSEFADAGIGDGLRVASGGGRGCGSCAVPQPIPQRQSSDFVAGFSAAASRSAAIFAITIFMMPSPWPVQETPPESASA